MNTAFKQSLKARAHHLKPVVLLGSKGLTPAVILEAEIAIKAHELIKIKLAHCEKEDRLAIAEELCSQLEAELVQIIGSIAIVYKQKEE